MKLAYYNREDLEGKLIPVRIQTLEDYLVSGLPRFENLDI